MTLRKKLSEAAARASELSSPKEGIIVQVSIQPHGYLIVGQRRQANGKYHNAHAELQWDFVDDVPGNALLGMVEQIVETVKGEPPAPASR